MKFPEEANCMFICDARGRAGLSIAPAGAEVTNVAGVAGFLSGSIVPRGASIMPSGASGKFHANRYIELTGLENGTFHDFGPQRGWFRSGH